MFELFFRAGRDNWLFPGKKYKLILTSPDGDSEPFGQFDSYGGLSPEFTGGRDRQAAEQLVDDTRKLLSRRGYKEVGRGSYWFSYRFERPNAPPQLPAHSTVTNVEFEGKSYAVPSFCWLIVEDRRLWLIDRVRCERYTDPRVGIVDQAQAAGAVLASWKFRRDEEANRFKELLAQKLPHSQCSSEDKCRYS
jgi:hypothetical protein